MNLDALQLKLASDYVFAVSEAALHFVYHEVCNTVAEAGKCTSSTTSLDEHCVSTLFSDVTGSGTALNKGADVLSADVDVEGLEFLMGGSYQVCHSSDGNFSSVSDFDCKGCSMTVRRRTAWRARITLALWEKPPGRACLLLVPQCPVTYSNHRRRLPRRWFVFGFGHFSTWCSSWRSAP